MNATLERWLAGLNSLVSSTPAQNETWTTRKLLAWMQQAFFKANLDSPRLLAEQMLAHSFGCERLKLYTEPDRPATQLERQNLRDMVARALKHEPIQYLVGEAWFFGMPFHVDRRVLIPRPCTQTIVEHVLQHARATHGTSNQRGTGITIADVCTGSGAIAIALLKRLPEARGVASDISRDALDVAEKNARRHEVADRLDVLEGNLLAPLFAHSTAGKHGSLDYFVSNPPYIPDHEWDTVEPNVKEHEPHLALRGGKDGLDLVRPLFADAPTLLKPGGLILIEVPAAHAKDALAIAAKNPLLTCTHVLRDCDGLDRIIVGTCVS